MAKFKLAPVEPVERVVPFTGTLPNAGAALVVATSTWPVVPAAVATGAAPAPPPYIIPYCVSKAEDVIAEVLEKYGIPPDVPAVRPVPPLPTAKVPVTPVVNGNPVALVKTAAEGVPRFGVTKTGLVVNASAPEPFTAVPSAVATPVPRPLTPVLIGNPVALVSVPDDGVPSAPPFTTNEPADPVFTAKAVATPVPGVVVAKVENAVPLVFVTVKAPVPVFKVASPPIVTPLTVVPVDA